MEKKSSYTYTEEKLRDLLWYFYRENNQEPSRVEFDLMFNTYIEGGDIYGIDYGFKKTDEIYVFWYETKCKRCNTLETKPFAKSVESYSDEKQKELDTFVYKTIQNGLFATCKCCKKMTVQEIVSYTPKK